MALHHSEPELEADRPGRGDPVRRLTRILLLIIVSPALLLVVTLGGLIGLAGKVSRLAGSIARHDRTMAMGTHSPAAFSPRIHVRSDD